MVCDLVLFPFFRQMHGRASVVLAVQRDRRVFEPLKNFSISPSNLAYCQDANFCRSAPHEPHKLKSSAVLDRVKGDLPAEQVLANTFPPNYNEDYTELFDLFARTRRRRALISAVARLRSYATRDRLSAQVRILDRRALTTVQFYNALFGLPDELFRKVVRAL